MQRLFYLSELPFWIIAGITILAIGVLATSTRIKGKGWLLGYLILSLFISIGHYIPNLLQRIEVLSYETYQRFFVVKDAALAALRICSWPLLLGFIFSIKSVEESGTMSGIVGSDVGVSLPPPVPSSPHKGYGGWLALFGAVHLFVNPILTGAMLVISAAGLASIDHKASWFNALVDIYFLMALGSFALTGLGMYAAIKLRGIRPGAVRTTKRYLLTALVWSVLLFALPYMQVLPDSAREAMLIENIKSFLRGVIPFVIWISYFNFSKRVKATYVD